MMGKIEELNKEGIIPKNLVPRSPRSKVIIHIELGCEHAQLEENLWKLHNLLEKTKNDTNEFYENTRVPLTELLTTAITKISKRGGEKDSIQINKLTPFDGWGCTITLSTCDQPHLT